MTSEFEDERIVIEDGGWVELDEGSHHYNAAMKCQASEEHGQRIAHFKEAERCYLASAMKGNAIAYLNLGYVYSYDRCEGDYESEQDLDVAAHYCFEMAADAGEPEALYKLGDMELAGRGCEKDAARAYGHFVEAYEAGKDVEPVLWGSAALRLGSCHENGEGCAYDPAKALEWYEVAEAGLQAAVNAGDWFYKRALKRASDGVRRMQQELSGEY